MPSRPPWPRGQASALPGAVPKHSLVEHRGLCEVICMPTSAQPQELPEERLIGTDQDRFTSPSSPASESPPRGSRNRGRGLPIPPGVRRDARRDPRASGGLPAVHPRDRSPVRGTDRGNARDAPGDTRHPTGSFCALRPLEPRSGANRPGRRRVHARTLFASACHLASLPAFQPRRFPAS